MGVLEYIEYFLSKLFYSVRGHDNKLFFKSPALANLPEPNITLECPQCGPSGSQMHIDHTLVGKGEFPHLKWSKPANLDSREYILICEDADAPVPFPVSHSVFYSIPAETTQVTHENIQFTNSTPSDILKGGFRWVPNLRRQQYSGPRPLLGHGPHRYFYQLIALEEPLDLEALGPNVSKKRIAEAIKGKVVGWGSWVGVYERTW